jgi:8-oxo-dGTP pyrophosphatase MutT (NUDIX family)
MDFDAFRDALSVQLHRPPAPVPQAQGTLRHASVVAIFRPAPGRPHPDRAPDAAPGEPELLLIRRAEVHGDPWSGHVAFPGGRMDPGDEGPVGAALREVREELGLSLADHGRILGEITGQLTMPGLGRQMVVHPFVAELRDSVPLTPNDEVARVIWVPWRHLLEGRGRGTMRWEYLGRELELPCRRLQGEVLWGMTLRMVEDLLHRWRRAG